MELAFGSKLLRTTCESETHARDELGTVVTELLKHRLSDLRAATTVTDLLVGNPRLLGDAENKHMIINLGESHRLVICANHPKNPIDKDGKIDWPKVTRIQIVGIEKYHG